MRWLIVGGLILIAVVMLMTRATDKRGASAERMKKVRAAKAKKRRARLDNFSHEHSNQGRQGGNQTQAGPTLKVA